MLKSTPIIVALGTACIMTSQSLGAGKSVRAQAGEIQIEISLTGIIEKTSDVSICMDGALYQIKHVIVGKDGSSQSVVTRTISKQKQVNDFLQRVAGTRQRAVVTGYPTMGAECPYLNAYYAGPASR